MDTIILLLLLTWYYICEQLARQFGDNRQMPGFFARNSWFKKRLEEDCVWMHYTSHMWLAWRDCEWILWLSAAWRLDTSLPMWGRHVVRLAWPVCICVCVVWAGKEKHIGATCFTHWHQTNPKLFAFHDWLPFKITVWLIQCTIYKYPATHHLYYCSVLVRLMFWNRRLREREWILKSAVDFQA